MNEAFVMMPRLGDREAVLHALYEAAELEHNLMCTYLYAAFSLKSDAADGLAPDETAAAARWRQALLDVAIEEMSHLTAVWNITSALGGMPRIGRGNFPIDPGYLPASVVVKLAPFNAQTLQHFIYLERPAGSDERDSEAFAVERNYVRGSEVPRLTPMGINYDTVGNFYTTLSHGLRAMVERCGEDKVFCGDPALQIALAEFGLSGARPVICVKTALAAFESIVMQGEGAPRDMMGSHFQRFLSVREELLALQRQRPGFAPAFPAATNPVLRRPPRPEGRVWIEDAEASAVVDLANASYSLMLRLFAYSYLCRAPGDEKPLVLRLAIGLMHAIVPLAERAARLPAGPSNPDCHAGMSFTTLRDSSPLQPGRAARLFFIERLQQLVAVGTALAQGGDRRVQLATEHLSSLSQQATRGFDLHAPAFGVTAPMTQKASPPPVAAPQSTIVDGVERVQGEKLELMFEAKRCIHARFCVTGAPKVFLANVQGPWIHPDAMPVERVVEIAHACPSGAIRYRRTDGASDEAAPPVNLASVRERGPYAFRGALQIDGAAHGFRATLCRCGASKNKPLCDGSHNEIKFDASGEPPTRDADMLAQRDGVLAIDPEPNGPLAVRGNLEIISGTGRVVARVTGARLCRCGGSASKPFCDGTHAKIGFRSS
ncbi:MAG TPA: ferritin-like domain-containing protein [Steroidobacteraceae bacterium]|nr:ferritin-like domain-containing protein [Steroidobacteraceae bacterium]